MEEFKQKRLTHWDYIWKDEQGRRFMGMVLLPANRKRAGRYLWELKKQLADAYKSKLYVPITILHQDSFLDIDGRICAVSADGNVITIQDLAGSYYTVRISDVLHIEYKNEGGNSSE